MIRRFRNKEGFQNGLDYVEIDELSLTFVFKNGKRVTDNTHPWSYQWPKFVSHGDWVEIPSVRYFTHRDKGNVVARLMTDGWWAVTDGNETWRYTALDIQLYLSSKLLVERAWQVQDDVYWGMDYQKVINNYEHRVKSLDSAIETLQKRNKELEHQLNVEVKMLTEESLLSVQGRKKAQTEVENLKEKISSLESWIQNIKDVVGRSNHAFQCNSQRY